MEINILDVEEKEYRCGDCGKTFKTTMDDPECPDCQSQNVKSA